MNNYKAVLLSLSIIFLFMYLLNTLMPIHRDDYDYALIWGTSQHINSFSDVIQSMLNHYLTHGGRMVTVFFLDLFLWFGKVYFDIANALVFTGLVILVYFHAKRNCELSKETGLLSLSAILLYLCLPHFGEVAVWKSGSTVYLWSGFIVALFLLPYNLSLLKALKWNVLMVIPMFILGILAGWSLENLAVTVILVTAFVSYRCYKAKRLSPWMIAGLLGAVLGLIGILAAPGNYVRYGEQSQGKGILAHIGNQFAGNGEMVLYILPIILVALLCYKILKLKLAKITIPEKTDYTLSKGQYISLIILALLIISYFTGSWFAGGLRDILIQSVLEPISPNNTKAITRFTNVMNGFEEMVIYLLILFCFYGKAKQALGLTNPNIKAKLKNIKAKMIWQAYPQIHYGVYLFILAIFNNFVMIAAPTFPARATFSSVCMIIIGFIAILRMNILQDILTKGRIDKIICTGTTLITAFMVFATVCISYQISQSDAIRINYISSKTGSAEIVLPPTNVHNRALRHVFYADFDNGVTIDGLKKYFKIKDIQVSDDSTLPSNSF